VSPPAKGGPGDRGRRGGGKPRPTGGGRSRSGQGAAKSGNDWRNPRRPTAGGGGRTQGAARTAGGPTRRAAGRAPRVASSGDRGLGGDQVEGRQSVRELLLAGRRRVREVWLVDDGDDAPILADIRELASAARVPVTVVGRGRFAGQARCEAPQGVLAFAAPLPEADIDELAAGKRPASAGGGAAAPRRRGQPAFLVALDGVTDPGNLGAILRSAECAGATGAVLPRHRAVHVTPAATKAAAGAIEYLPIAVVGGLPAALARLRGGGVHVVGLDGDAPGSLYELADPAGPVCLVLGAEGRGLSRLVRERCDQIVAIPMHGSLGSLNVAAAAALACFEIARHR
jgi:23S rRNA (guanosine2251-2'-O)-methyltransferase